MTLSMKGFLFTKALNEQTTKGKDQKNLTALQSRRAVLSKSTKKKMERQASDWKKILATCNQSTKWIKDP